MEQQNIKCVYCNTNKKIIQRELGLGLEKRILECGHESVMHIRIFSENIRVSDNFTFQMREKPLDS